VTAVEGLSADASSPPPSVVELARRLTLSDRLRARRLELLPLIGPGAAFTDVQGRQPGEATAPAALADLISSIGAVGVLQPILVEEADGRRLVVAGERRLRAARWGATADPENPHYQSIPAVICPGPLAEEERRVWQLVENLAREDLQPGELGAALLFERCAVMGVKLLAAGVTVPAEVFTWDDPVARYRHLDRLRAGNPKAAAPWDEVLRRLGIQLSARQARALVAAFTALPPELSSDFDAHKITLTTRQSYLRLDTGRSAAAEQLWAAVKARGNTRLLAAATAEILEQPDLNPDDAVDLAEQRHHDANAARAARLTRNDHDAANDADEVDEVDEVDGGPDEPRGVVSAEVVTAALTALRRLLSDLRGGAQQLTGYQAGSLRLCIDELATLLRNDGNTVTPTPYH